MTKTESIHYDPCLNEYIRDLQISQNSSASSIYEQLYVQAPQQLQVCVYIFMKVNEEKST